MLMNMTQRDVVDETDLKILNLIRRDARLSFREIGKKLSLSTGTVSERIKQMQARGVIQGFVTAVDPEMLGYRMTLMIEIRLGSGYPKEEMIAHFEETEEACCLHDVTGDIDFMVLVRTSDQHHAAKVLESIRTMEGVDSVESHVVLNQKTLCGRCGCDCGWSLPRLMHE